MTSRKTKFEHVTPAKEKSCAVFEISGVCLEYEMCSYQQRSGECVIGCTDQGGQKCKEEQQQIVAILHSILRSADNQCKSTRRRISCSCLGALHSLALTLFTSLR